MPKLAALTDNFATGINASVWTPSQYNCVYDSALQAVRIYASAATTATLTSAGGYVQDLTASSVYARLNFPVVPVYDIRFTLTASPGNNTIGMRVNNGVLTCYVVNTGTQTTYLTVNYDPTIHGPWWRLRETGGLVYFETSANGLTWVTQTTVTTPAFANAVQLQFYAFSNAGGSTTPLASMTVDNVNTGFPVAPTAADPWVLLTGPKGPTGVPLSIPPPFTQGAALGAGTASSLTPGSLPSSVFRRYCWNKGGGALFLLGDTSGFVYASNMNNYAGGHGRLQMTRSPQGIVTYSGLVTTTGGSTPICYLPWDGLPNPIANEICTIVNVNNQYGRYDIYPSGTAMMYQYSTSAVALPAAGAFIGVQCSFATYVPVVWVDYGLRTEAAQFGPTSLAFTVGPGQMSGLVKGAPVTVQLPNVNRFQLDITGTLWAWLYYDLVAGSFGVRNLSDPGQRGLNIVTDPAVWMGMANEGKVSVACWYNSGASSGLTDRRYFIRGPLDRFENVPA